MVEQLLGPDIAGHPVWNLRTKTPRSDAISIPWHQDSAYFSNESYDHMIVTAWVPFLDAIPGNGCMQFSSKDRFRYSFKIESKMASCCI
ncbi:hypothetical protein KP79_PYT04609 [Mizuhopecten yessoensis]|uniref:Phytanoyl-CoA dioxygenase n=1 Tax=Mizuhopecten yessoensis TaxID=6573 RepID=A0A210QS80_MIZYE|nr:hypothetical protein KP79_PYT04609 [Mizuhopecten yessoensis]